MLKGRGRRGGEGERKKRERPTQVYIHVIARVPLPGLNYTYNLSKHRLPSTRQPGYKRLTQRILPVSYTHLDVYKRQALCSAI